MKNEQKTRAYQRETLPARNIQKWQGPLSLSLSPLPLAREKRVWCVQTVYLRVAGERLKMPLLLYVLLNWEFNSCGAVSCAWEIQKRYRFQNDRSSRVRTEGSWRAFLTRVSLLELRFFVLWVDWLPAFKVNLASRKNWVNCTFILVLFINIVNFAHHFPWITLFPLNNYFSFKAK